MILHVPLLALLLREPGPALLHHRGLLFLLVLQHSRQILNNLLNVGVAAAALGEGRDIQGRQRASAPERACRHRGVLREVHLEEDRWRRDEKVRLLLPVVLTGLEQHVRIAIAGRLALAACQTQLLRVLQNVGDSLLDRGLLLGTLHGSGLPGLHLGIAVGLVFGKALLQHRDLVLGMLEMPLSLHQVGLSLGERLKLACLLPPKIYELLVLCCVELRGGFLLVVVAAQHFLPGLLESDLHALQDAQDVAGLTWLVDLQAPEQPVLQETALARDLAHNLDCLVHLADRLAIEGQVLRKIAIVLIVQVTCLRFLVGCALDLSVELFQLMIGLRDGGLKLPLGNLLLLDIGLDLFELGL
mmetsp:Transcript_135719/g.378101  ORF Transcript_135719/g.378101 Transcript_135719/m.378101 type:complete len:357 (+) Transcript_135719:986-2056(+)